MKFMRLGSKPDSFQTDENGARYVASELASDIVVSIGDVKFYLHKFPLLSKSARLQTLVIGINEKNSDEVDISDIPGGSAAFEVCAKFCYGMTVTLNAYNVIAARCAAEFLEMNEKVEKGNLVYKIDVFLTSSILRSWKDSIIVLQTSKSLMPFSENLKVISQCIDATATKACIDVSKVDWSYTYNRKKLREESGIEPNYNNGVPMDWWVEDLCELEIDLYKHVVSTIKTKAVLPNEVIGEALKAYAYRWLPGFCNGTMECGDKLKHSSTVETLIWLLPAEKASVSCSFLLQLLKAVISVELGDSVEAELITKIAHQLEEASVNDLLIKATEEETTMYDVNTVQRIVQEFLNQDQTLEIESPVEGPSHKTRNSSGILSDASKLIVAKLIDKYLVEIAKDPHLPVSKFAELAEMVCGISRPSHDGLYRAIDMYLKEHPCIKKSDRKRICKLMDCKKLSIDACMHAVQNERLPLRVVVQVLYFEQVRVSASSGSSTPELHNIGLHGSSRSATTNTEEEWDAVAAGEELKSLKKEIASLRLSNGVGKSEKDGAAMSKMKGLLKSKKIFVKLWSSKGCPGEMSGSDSSESLSSANQDEAKSTPSRNRRHSVS